MMIKDITIECCNCSFQNTLSTKIEHQIKIKKYFWCKQCNCFQGYILEITNEEIRILDKLPALEYCVKRDKGMTIKKSYKTIPPIEPVDLEEF
jgi:hypothetical protein